MSAAEGIRGGRMTDEEKWRRLYELMVECQKNIAVALAECRKWMRNDREEMANENHCQR